MSFGLDNFHSRFVYRVLRPDEDKNESITCKDANSKRSLSQHVETGLWIPSKYISTARTLEKAKKWLETADKKTSHTYGNKRTTIVKIDVSKIKSDYPQIAESAIDLTSEINRNCFLENELQRNFAKAYEEVVFVKCIPYGVITVVYPRPINAPSYVPRSRVPTMPMQSTRPRTANATAVSSEARNAHYYQRPMNTPSHVPRSTVSATPIQPIQPRTANATAVSSEARNAHYYQRTMNTPSHVPRSTVSTTPIQPIQPRTAITTAVSSEARNAHYYQRPMNTPSHVPRSTVSTTPIQPIQPRTANTTDMATFFSKWDIGLTAVAIGMLAIGIVGKICKS